MSRRRLAVSGLVGLTALACGTTTGGKAELEPSGERLFQTSGCAACHIDGAGAIAPGLAGIYGSEVLLVGGKTVMADEAYLRESILDPGRAVVSGYQAVMPEFAGRLSDEEVYALVEYIRSLGD